MDVVLKMLSIVEANYPEALKQCYVVNGRLSLYSKNLRIVVAPI